MTSDKNEVVGLPKFEKALESDIKKFILRNSKLFGNVGRSTVLFEKNINEYSVIADCLIFSENKGIIGVEIKTERDNTKRLNKQLTAYTALCDFTWVLCHDKQLKHVEEVIKKGNHQNVGIISYSIFEEQIIAGVIQDANISPNYKPHVALDLLWKPELLRLAHKHKSGTFSNQSFMESSGVTPVSNRLKKYQLIRWILQTVGTRKAVDLVVELFLNHDLHFDRTLNFHEFHDEGEEEFAKKRERYRTRKSES